MESMKRWKRNL